MTAQAHAAHEIGFNNFVPFVIRDRLERLDVVHAKVVDQNVDLGEVGGDTLCDLGVAQIARACRKAWLEDVFAESLRSLRQRVFLIGR
jgi:hypothetical protein